MGWACLLTWELVEGSIVSFESVNEHEKDLGRIGHRSFGSKGGGGREAQATSIVVAL